MIQRYRIKSSPEREEFLEVLRRTDTGCHVRIVRCYEGYESVTESFLEVHLFKMCLHTGYLREDENPDPRMGEDISQIARGRHPEALVQHGVA